MEGLAVRRVLVLVIVLIALLLGGSLAPAVRPPAAGSAALPGPFPVRTDAFDNKTGLSRQGLVIPMGATGSFDELQAAYPSVLYDGGMYKMWYFGCTSSYYCQIGYATSADGKAWTKQGPVLSPSLAQETSEVVYPAVLKVGSQFWMWYDGYDGSIFRIFAANSTDGIHWTKHGVVLGPGPTGANDSFEVLYPSAILVGSTIYLYYVGLTSPVYPHNAQVMLATSTNGLTWTRVGTVLSWGPPGSLDCCNVVGLGVAASGTGFEGLYTAVGPDNLPRLFYAQSSDGRNWQKLRVALAPDAAEHSVGSASIILLPNGTFFVYYVVRNFTSDLSIYLAWGEDDLWPPTVVLSATGTHGNHGWYTSLVQVQIEASDNLSGVGSVQYRLNGGSWQGYLTPFSLSDGVTLVEARATDNVGNVGTAPPLVVSEDRVAPTVSVDVHGGTVTTSAVTIHWNGSDGGSGIDHYALSVDGQPYLAEGTNTSATVTLSDGPHVIHVEAVDVAGNIAFDSGTVNVDTNIWSSTGPFGPLLFDSLIVALVAIPFVVFVALVYWMFRSPRRRT